MKSDHKHRCAKCNFLYYSANKLNFWVWASPPKSAWAVFKHWGSETNVRREGRDIWTLILLIVLTSAPFGDTSIPAG